MCIRKREAATLATRRSGVEIRHALYFFERSATPNLNVRRS
jgi:hypothetical protein